MSLQKPLSQSITRGGGDLREVLLIVKSVHLFFKAIDHAAIASVAGTADIADLRKRTAQPPFLKIWSQYTSMVMDAFPFVSPSETFPPSLVLDLNLEVCTTVIDAYLDGVKTERAQLERVMAYLFYEVEQCRPRSQADRKNKGNIDDNMEEDTPIDALFEAFERLLAISDTAGFNINQRLVTVVASAFFPGEYENGSPKNEEVVRDIARSVATRKCALLTRKIIGQHNWSITTSSKGASCGNVLAQVLRGLVNCIVAWESDYLYETNEILSLLHNVVRRVDVASDLAKEESFLLDHMRISFVSLVEHKKKRKDAAGSGSACTFEMFPTDLQRKFVGLVAMLQCPPQGMLDGLCRVCVTYWGQRDSPTARGTASFIVQSIHNIRKTMSMQAYLCFITSSTGVGSQRSSVKSTKDILHRDESVSLACNVLCQCGWHIVLPVLRPLLEQWMSIDPNTTPTLDWIFSARAALSMLASCTLNAHHEPNFSVFQMAPELETPAGTAICIILKQIDDSDLSLFLEQFTTLFQYYRRLFYQVWKDISVDIPQLTISDQSKLVSALLVFANDARLSSLIKGQKHLVECAKDIEHALASSSAERIGGRLSAIMEVHCSSLMD